MAKRTLNKRQLQRRARKVYSAVANVFGKAQLSARPKKNALRHQTNMASTAEIITTFTNDPSIVAVLRRSKGPKKIVIGRVEATRYPGGLTPNLAEEFLHNWKLCTPESKAGHFIANAVRYYLITKHDKNLRLLKRNKLQELINAANKAPLRGVVEENEIKTPLGKMTGYDIGDAVGEYASKLEQKIRLRHSGLFFLALIDKGMTIEQAEQRVKQIAKMRKKQIPRL